jgi:hypothetical protein
MDNKTLAKMAGYRVGIYDQLRQMAHMGYYGGCALYAIHDQDGNRVTNYTYTDSGAWKLLDVKPNFLGSVDAALRLIPSGVEWYLHCVDMRCVHDTEWFQKGDSPIIRYWAAIEDLLAECEDSRYTETPAQAICRAWMAWKEAQE